MAVIGLRTLVLLVAAALVAAADQPHDVLQVISRVSNSLTNGDPSDAIGSFSKTFPRYGTLQNYFVALTNAFEITNEADVVDEEDLPTQTNLTLEWSITLTGRATNENDRRTEQVHVKLLLKNHKWEIVDFSPISIFDPQVSPVGK